MLLANRASLCPGRVLAGFGRTISEVGAVDRRQLHLRLHEIMPTAIVLKRARASWDWRSGLASFSS